MKSKHKIILNTLLCLSISVINYNCSETSTTPPPPPGPVSPYPNIGMKVGSIYKYNNDTIRTTGDTVRTRVVTTNTFLAKGMYYGQPNVFQIYSLSRDTVSTQIISSDTFYVRWDSAGGKFYTYGLTSLLDTTQQGSWDLIADFSVPRGTEYQITIDTIRYGSYTVVANVKGKVADSTTIYTTSNPYVTVLCYRIEIRGDLTFAGFPVGTVYIDYFLGYSPPSMPSNPSGNVRIILRPFTIFGAPFPGFNQQLQSFIIP